MILFHVVFIVLFIKMDITTSVKPKTMAEMLPGLSSILSQDSIQSLTAKKQPRQTLSQSRTAEKVVKPLTIAEMRGLISLKDRSPARSFAKGIASTSKKKNWNSSVKVDKLVSHTANGRLKNNPVRKVLNFQPKPNTTSRVTMATELPVFSKPELRAKKSLHQLQVRNNNVRISGVASIAETPVVNIPYKSRTPIVNKENVPYLSNIKRNVPPKLVSHNNVIPVVPDTPLSDVSWKSNGDASFLQTEEEINEQERAKNVPEQNKLENMIGATPPVSKLFKDYRTAQEFLSPDGPENCDTITNNNDTIMSFDNNEDIKSDDTTIVSLCDLLSNVSIKCIHRLSSPAPRNLAQLESASKHNLRILEHSIQSLMNLRRAQLNSIHAIRRLMHENCFSKPRKIINNKQKHVKVMNQKKTHLVKNVDTSPWHRRNGTRKSTLPKVLEDVKELKSFKDKELDELFEITPKNLDAMVAKDDKDTKSSPPALYYESKSTTCESSTHKSTTRKSSTSTTRKSSTRTREIPTQTTHLATKSVKLPSYVIPKKKTCLRKKILYKSLPNLSNDYDTPIKPSMSKQAFSMYMNMKKHMNFLVTPRRHFDVDKSDTPSVTSLNLQKQLDELYD